MITRGVLPFLGVASLVIATPGQDTVLTIRNTLAGGRRAGFSTALGVCAGQSIWGVLVSLGVGAVIAASERAFVTLRVLGGGFLLLLGAGALLAAVRSRHHEVRIADSGHGLQLKSSTALRQGLLSNLLNPKMLAFFTSLLPQFARSFPALLVLGLVFSLMTLTWLSGYTLVVARTARVLGRPRLRQAIDVATGIVLIALGARLATEGG